MRGRVLIFDQSFWPTTRGIYLSDLRITPVVRTYRDDIRLYAVTKEAAPVFKFNDFCPRVLSLLHHFFDSDKRLQYVRSFDLYDGRDSVLVDLGPEGRDSGLQLVIPEHSFPQKIRGHGDLCEGTKAEHISVPMEAYNLLGVIGMVVLPTFRCEAAQILPEPVRPERDDSRISRCSGNGQRNSIRVGIHVPSCCFCSSDVDGFIASFQEADQSPDLVHLDLVCHESLKIDGSVTQTVEVVKADNKDRGVNAGFARPIILDEPFGLFFFRGRVHESFKGLRPNVPSRVTLGVTITEGPEVGTPRLVREPIGAFHVPLHFGDFVGLALVVHVCARIAEDDYVLVSDIGRYSQHWAIAQLVDDRVHFRTLLLPSVVCTRRVHEAIRQVPDYSRVYASWDDSLFQKVFVLEMR